MFHGTTLCNIAEEGTAKFTSRHTIMLCFSELDPDTLNRRAIPGLHEHLCALPFKL